jgi:hypothetical protein
MSTVANISVREHIEVTLRYADRKGGNQIANIDKMTEAEPIASSNPPKISHLPDEFFNNIGRELPHAPPDTGHSAPGVGRVSRPIRHFAGAKVLSFK